MTILIFVSCSKLLDNILIVKAIQLGSTNTPENSEFLHAERAQLSLLATPFMANTLPHQILQSHTQGKSKKQQLKSSTLRPLCQTKGLPRGWCEGALGSELPPLPLLK